MELGGSWQLAVGMGQKRHFVASFVGNFVAFVESSFYEKQLLR